MNQIKADIKEEQREEARIAKEAEREEKRIIDAANKARKDREIMEKLVAQELSKLESSSDEQKETVRAAQIGTGSVEEKRGSRTIARSTNTSWLRLYNL